MVALTSHSWIKKEKCLEKLDIRGQCIPWTKSLGPGIRAELEQFKISFTGKTHGYAAIANALINFKKLLSVAKNNIFSRQTDDRRAQI